MKRLIALVCVVCAGVMIQSESATAQGAVVVTGQPGPYEVHQYVHRTNSFQRAPYYATNPPVYYNSSIMTRSYGWTPYPYQGVQQFHAVVPMVPGARARAQKSVKVHTGRGLTKSNDKYRVLVLNRWGN